MSLAIDPEKVTAVLLADGWHDVRSFYIDAYEYVEGMANRFDDYFLIYNGGAGFRIVTTDKKTISGPITSLLAVRS